MITFHSRTTTILAIFLIIYLFYSKYKNSVHIDPAFKSDLQEISDRKSAENALYKIKVPQDKKYSDYNPLEKFIYFFSKTNMDN